MVIILSVGAGGSSLPGFIEAEKSLVVFNEAFPVNHPSSYRRMAPLCQPKINSKFIW